MSTDSKATSEHGALERDGDKQVVRFRRHLDHPVKRVWAALTEPAEMIGWWGDADVDLVDGGEFTVRWLNTDDQGNFAVMHARITKLEPPHILETSGDMHGVLRWELRPEADGTVLTFSSTLDLADEYRTKVLAGWHFHLDRLAGALDGHPFDWSTWIPDGFRQWAVLEKQYAPSNTADERADD